MYVIDNFFKILVNQNDLRQESNSQLAINIPFTNSR